MAAEDKKIVVAGLVCVDVTPQFPHKNTRDFHELLQPGKVVGTKGITISAGGAVANTGLGIAKLGGSVHLMTKIGNDFLGDFLEREFKKYSVSSTILHTDQGSTSYSIVLAVPGYDRIFLHDTGCNDCFSWRELDDQVIREACIFHFGYPQSMRRFYQNSAKELIEMYRHIKELGTATSLDMAVAAPGGEASRVNWCDAVKGVIPYVDIFLPSIEELSCAVDPAGFLELNKKAAEQKKSFAEVVSLEYVKEQAGRLMEWGGKIVLIKCGTQGMFLKTASREALLEIGGGLTEAFENWGSQEIFMPCFEPECVKSGTGAGDVSIAAFLLALQRKYPLKRCVELAAASGASCVASYDALSNIPRLEELNYKIEQGWRRKI
ncbi:MAG: carbohydrate kinase family protein [Lachnospiraceae bacterium]|jgi:sugar/nucleoside kinase (ribokinase family)|nr:carbohydrate kinase family protein [Lachnospiraceae bacterium]MCI9477420.1 carbohydrate kinase family protein [Lachnospiraceae bacterium]